MTDLQQSSCPLLPRATNLVSFLSWQYTVDVSNCLVSLRMSDHGIVKCELIPLKVVPEHKIRRIVYLASLNTKPTGKLFAMLRAWCGAPFTNPIHKLNCVVNEVISRFISPLFRIVDRGSNTDLITIVEHLMLSRLLTVLLGVVGQLEPIRERCMLLLKPRA